MFFIGIDPGKSGAVAIMHGEKVTIEDMPLDEDGHIDTEVLCDVIGMHVVPDKSFCVLERAWARPLEGVKSAFALGETYGLTKAVLDILKIETLCISPSVWKKFFDITSDKEVSRSLAQQLFPTQHHMLARKKDHNRAEALLLCEYAQRVHLEVHGRRVN